MIGYIKGKLLKKEEDRILLLANDLGYEVHLPAVVMETLAASEAGTECSLFIYYHQTDRQPKPVLIGFNQEIEKAFFQRFISVEDIGPLKALKAFNLPFQDIATAIESKDVSKLKQLKGIGQRTAQKMIATLHGKMDKFTWQQPAETKSAPFRSILVDPVTAVLVDQLGHRKATARKMIDGALKRNPAISTPEALIEEVLRGEEAA
ncbi:MAG: Holliday junction DNA helicase RuvA [Deltaproteobacteria bacterium]|nr:Holliday junction DNA helicase RuvA [Deltaproteobacteria bacterium]